MNLVIFDIDGTLTQTNRVDNECYEETFAQMFGHRVISDDWHNLEHMTDAGILDGLLRNLRGSGPAPAETDVFKKAFFARLGRARTGEPKAFGPVPGAGELLDLLRTAPDWSVALATGGWRCSALLKLEAAALPFQGLPLATSDDAVSRTDIVGKAVKRAQRMNPGNYFEKIVSVGDGAWDVRAAREMGLSFVGIGPEEKLRKHGAAHVRPDLANAREFLELLARAGPPNRAGGL